MYYIIIIMRKNCLLIFILLMVQHWKPLYNIVEIAHKRQLWLVGVLAYNGRWVGIKSFGERLINNNEQIDMTMVSIRKRKRLVDSLNQRRG